jgi:hypothetical protein
MNIDKIIQESINRLVDEARGMSDAEKMWSNLEGGVAKRRGGGGAPRGKRFVPNNIYEAVTLRQLGPALRKTWDGIDIKKIVSFNRNVFGIYGAANREAFENFFRPAPGQPTLVAQFQTKYRQVDELTKQVEQWAKEGDKNSVEYRLRDLPKPLEELADILKALWEKGQILKKCVRKGIPLPGGMKPSVVMGYVTSAGISNLIIYAGGPNDISVPIDRLKNLAEYIRNKWGDNLQHGKVAPMQATLGNDNELDIRTKRR